MIFTFVIIVKVTINYLNNLNKNKKNNKIKYIEYSMKTSER
jgi:hypothetical protein